MQQAILTSVTCPNCRRPFNARLEQIFDVSQDPQAKARLLNGRFNVVTCPYCGFHGALSTPIVYHDADKELLLVYMPMELNLREVDRQRLIGDLTNRILSGLPPERRKSYLLQPKQFISLQSLIEAVLQAEGITPEMLAEEKARLDLAQQLLQADDASFAELVREHQDKLDYAFFELLTVSAEAAQAEGRTNAAAQLYALRERLLPLTAFGKQVAAQQAAVERLEKAAQEAGGLTQEMLVEHLIAAQDNDAALQALVTVGRPAINYNFYLILAGRIDQAKAAGQLEEAQRLEALRERILQLVEALDQRSRAAFQQAANTLRQILSSPDPRQAVREHLAELDDVFMTVLGANLEAAQALGRAELVRRLEEIGDLVLQEIQRIAPPEVQLVNALLAAPDDAAARRILDERRAQVTPRFQEFVAGLVQGLRQEGQDEAAGRLERVVMHAG